MGKLVHDYVNGPPVLHLRAVRSKDRIVPTRTRVSYDPSDLKYAMVDGVRRRRPESLPAHRRHAAMATSRAAA